MSAGQLVSVTTVIVLVAMTSSAPDMFTALVDMQRALNDEQSAAMLLKQYVTIERQRLHELERYYNTCHGRNHWGLGGLDLPEI